MKERKNLIHKSLMIVVLLAALTALLSSPPMAYAGGDDDGNKQKVEDKQPEPDVATLTVCKQGVPDSIPFSVTGNNPSPSQFNLDTGNCQHVTIGPGMYQIVVSDPNEEEITHSGNCTQDPNDVNNAVGKIESGETQTCTFTFL